MKEIDLRQAKKGKLKTIAFKCTFVDISWKGGNHASSGFHNAAQSLRKGKKSQDSKNSENDQKGRNRHN